MCRPSDESFFTLFWVDQNLDKAVSQVILQSRRAILRSKKPTLGESTKEDSAAILDNMGYGFARDPNNTTVAALAKSLMEIKQRMEYDRDDGWSEEIICEYPEEVLTHFVDENGKPSKVKYDKDEFGRQCIGFFLPNLSAPVTSQPQQFSKLVQNGMGETIERGAADPAETGADDPAGAAVDHPDHPTDRTVMTIAMTAGMAATT
jgi:hypothetical protein